MVVEFRTVNHLSNREYRGMNLSNRQSGSNSDPDRFGRATRLLFEATMPRLHVRSDANVGGVPSSDV